jgi:integrase
MAASDIKPFTQDDVDHPERFLDMANPKAKLISFGNHLLLQVTPTKPRSDGTFTVAASWIYRFSIDGRERRAGLGRNKDGSRLSLDDARAEVRNLQKDVHDKKDPLARREREKLERTREDTVVTFRTAALEYIAAQEAGWTSRYRKQWERTLDMYVYPKLSDVPCADVTAELVLRVLEPHWRKNTANMRKIRARIAKILGYAASKGYRPRGVNPAAWADGLEHSLSSSKRTKHHAALQYEKVGAFMTQLRRDGRIAARATEFCVLTAARTHEVRFATWAEIDLVKRLWTIPVDRLKMRGEEDRPPHIVPLSEAACAILEALKDKRTPRPDTLIFAGRTDQRLANNALQKAVKRIAPGATPHGFRSCFTDWAGDRAGAPDEISEFCLGHVKTGLATAYRRRTAVEKRRKLLEQWGEYCGAIEGDNVVSFAKPA